MSQRTVTPPPGPGIRRWLLPLILVLVIVGVILGAYFATHHSSGNSAAATKTPTAVPSSTPKPSPTATLLPTATAPAAAKKPTPTPTPGQGTTTGSKPARTPTPAVTPTPKVTPTPTVKLGTFTYPQSKVQTIQQGAFAGNPAYTFFLDPFKVTREQLAEVYGFRSGPVTIVSPPSPPQPTPTPYTNARGLPEIKVTVQYQGKRYVVVLDQPGRTGPEGIWLVYAISAT